MMKRREFITLLGGAAAAWPLVAQAQQQPKRMRRIGVLSGQAVNDPQGQARVTAFLQELSQLGWSSGRNIQIDARWAAGNADDVRKYTTTRARSSSTAPDGRRSISLLRNWAGSRTSI
jgi:putative tryptophan/tyrosine transport system substrate-binding protein